MLEHFELDPNVDLTLVVGAVEAADEEVAEQAATDGEREDKIADIPAMKGCTMLVSRRHVATASPVFKAMLGPMWKEADEARIPLPDDDPSALLLLLRFAHIQFDMNPSVIDRALLSRIAVLCDKCDCVRLTKPWLKGWVLEHKFFETYQIGDAFICWSFGLEKPFEHAMRTLMQHSTLSSMFAPSGLSIISKIMYDGRSVDDEVSPPFFLGMRRNPVPFFHSVSSSTSLFQVRSDSRDEGQRAR